MDILDKLPEAGVLFVLVGPPGCGKSFMANRLEKKYGCELVSSDKVREELYGDESFQGDKDEVFGRVHDLLREKLLRSNVVYDATNCKRIYRMKVLHETDGYFQLAIALVSTTPLKKCLENNRLRFRNVPEGIIRDMWWTLNDEPCTKSEGFDAVGYF